MAWRRCAEGRAIDHKPWPPCVIDFSRDRVMAIFMRLGGRKLMGLANPPRPMRLCLVGPIIWSGKGPAQMLRAARLYPGTFAPKAPFAIRP